MEDKIFLAIKDYRPPVMEHIADAVTLLEKSHPQILTPTLCEDARRLCNKHAMDSEFLFKEKKMESMREGIETFKMSKKTHKMIIPNQYLRSLTLEQVHCAKSIQIRSFFWSVFSCIESEYREIRTRKNSVFGHFSRSGSYYNSDSHDPSSL